MARNKGSASEHVIGGCLRSKWHAAKRMRISCLKGVAGAEAEGRSLGSVMEKGFNVQRLSDWFDDNSNMSAENRGNENVEDRVSLITHQLT
jgi:hypothetical protein